MITLLNIVGKAVLKAGWRLESTGEMFPHCYPNLFQNELSQ